MCLGGFGTTAEVHFLTISALNDSSLQLWLTSQCGCLVPYRKTSSCSKPDVCMHVIFIRKKQDVSRAARLRYWGTNFLPLGINIIITEHQRVFAETWHIGDVLALSTQLKNAFQKQSFHLQGGSGLDVWSAEHGEGNFHPHHYKVIQGKMVLCDVLGLSTNTKGEKVLLNSIHKQLFI